MNNADFIVRFWGVRGSIACPGPNTARYGGNTSCIEVRCGEQLFVFDGGSGLRLLGKQGEWEGFRRELPTLALPDAEINCYAAQAAGNAEMVRGLGADHVIDYASEDITSGDARYDFILDGVGNHPMRRMRTLLAPGGRLLSNGAPTGGWSRPIGHFLVAGIVSTFNKRQVRPFDAKPDIDIHRDLVELVESGQLQPVIDRTYPLDDGAEGVAYVAERHSRGNTVITM